MLCSTVDARRRWRLDVKERSGRTVWGGVRSTAQRKVAEPLEAVPSVEVATTSSWRRPSDTLATKGEVHGATGWLSPLQENSPGRVAMKAKRAKARFPRATVTREVDTTVGPRSVAPSVWLGLGGFADAGMFRTMAPGVVASVAWRAPTHYALRAALGGSATPERPIHLWQLSTRGELWVGETTALGGGVGVDAGLLHGRERSR